MLLSLCSKLVARMLRPNTKTVVSTRQENTCDEVFSYKIEGHNSIFIAEEDKHNIKFDGKKLNQTFAEFANSKELLDAGLGEHCVYTISVYPTQRFEDAYDSSKPVWYAGFILIVFAVTSVMFLVYDILVRRRQAKVLSSATKSNAIVSVSCHQ